MNLLGAEGDIVKIESGRRDLGIRSARTVLSGRGLVLGGLLALIGGQAVAQEAGRQAAVLEEVTVTARKVRENLQETPVAITAMSGDALEQRQAFQTEKLTQVVPNLQFGTNAPLAGNNASSQVFIRGIGQTDPTSTVDPGVGLYIDDVYIGSAVGARMDLRDINNVQALRGPQGTLFGRDRKSTRLNSSHSQISYAVFCLKKNTT